MPILGNLPTFLTLRGNLNILGWFEPLSIQEVLHTDGIRTDSRSCDVQREREGEVPTYRPPACSISIDPFPHLIPRRIAMNEPTPAVSQTTRQQDEWFFSQYEWSLNPILTVKELLDRLQQEIERYTSLTTKWQREESLISLSLFVCAIACTVDDYLSWRPWVLTPLGDLFPQISFLIPVVQGTFNLPYEVTSTRNIKTVRRWRESWTDYVDRTCRFLLRNQDLSGDEIAALRNDLAAMRQSPLPEKLLRRRMKLNEGYRCQDLTHHDIVRLADRFVDAHPGKDKKIAVIGPRTAGAYFAPLVKAHLQNRGFKDVTWVTLRPKRGISSQEHETLRRMVGGGALVLLTDDYSNTGRTFRLVQKKIIRLGVPARSITILAPIHPTQPEVPLALTTATNTLILRHTDLYKRGLMEPACMEPLLREYLCCAECDELTIRESPAIDEVNTRLWRHYRDSFQVRLKRVYEVEIRCRDRQPVIRRVFAKSVGWGWTGYHAYIAATRLKGAVPEVIGWRQGLLLTDWIDGQPWLQKESADNRADTLSAYIIQRVRRLRLSEDPRFQPPDFGWGWLEILRILRRVYGVYFGYLKHDVLISRLQRIVGPVPTLIDGRMRPDEWLLSDRGPIKLDFEHHNFGAPEYDIVDPAYDLAGASFEFRLSDAESDATLQAYIAATGDATMADRILLYRILYATLAKRRALERLLKNSPDEDQEGLNQRYLWSWNSMVFTMNRFCASLIRTRGDRGSNGQLAFIDLDGVLDSEVLGFPHTTTSGLLALALLQAKGVTVIPNTGRNIGHVRNYCSSYRFQAGVAEYGSVILDAKSGTEIPLIDADVSAQLNRCREALKSIPGVFIDPGYRYSVRAYRYNAQRTVGLNERESSQILNDHHLSGLKSISRADDTYFVGTETGKGNAIPRVKEMLPSVPDRTFAIGDSDEDLSMLKGVDQAFAPRNCSAGVQALAKAGESRIVKEVRQRGLLQFAQDILREGTRPGQDALLDPGDEGTVRNLMVSLLSIAEQSRVRRAMAIFDHRNL